MFYSVNDNGILNVNIGKSARSKEQAMYYIANHIKGVSSGELLAVIYTFENDDVLQFCGNKDLFRVECLKDLGNTPNIRALKMYERANLPGKFSFMYGENKASYDISALIPGDILSEIIEYTIFYDKKDSWESYLTHLCNKFNLYTDYYFMSSRGFTKIYVCKRQS